MRRFGTPLLDGCAPKQFGEHQAMFDPSYPHGRCYYVRACDVAELSDDVVDVMVEHTLRIRSPLSSCIVWQLGGAQARIDEDATAFSGRHAGHAFNIFGITEAADGFDAEREWARDFCSALALHHTSVYVNFLMDEGEARIRQAYGAAKHDRLKALKRRYNPDNVFRLNQNIRP